MIYSFEPCGVVGARPLRPLSFSCTIHTEALWQSITR
nr:MAG TPA: hypothetical protein [Caudoviricetes sp.]